MSVPGANAQVATSRRGLLKAGLAGSLLLGFYLPVRAGSGQPPHIVNEPEQGPDDTAGKFAPNAFIRIAADGKTTLIMPQVEMGQGVYTAVAMILAEELDADFTQVVLEHAPPNDKLVRQPDLRHPGHRQFPTRSARSGCRCERAGAAARAMLVEAAAQRWKVAPTSCSASNGKVIHAASGRTLAYSALVEAASRIAPPKDPPLKDPKAFTLIGKPVKRFDTPNKVDGGTVYGIDAMLPGMKFATLAMSPVFGGKVGHVDDTAAKAVPGVNKVVVLGDMVAVVGDHMWAAMKGMAALDVTWDEGPNAGVTSDTIWRDLRAASAGDGVVAKTVGDVERGLGQGDRVEAAYELPFLAHATMEPMNCTVQLKPGSCELWLGTQVISRVQGTVAKLLGLPPEKVTVHNHFLGGGFGRRLEPDMALKAVRVAQQLNGEPVKVVWTREEDIRQDIYRPVYRDVISASLSGGKITAMKYKVAGSSILARWLPPAFQHGIDIDSVDSAVDNALRRSQPAGGVRARRGRPRSTTGFWRGVGPNNNVFAIESFMDELARKAGKDPIAFRRDMLGKSPRLRAALDLVAQKSGWGQALPPRVGRGVCVQPSFGSFIATVVEAEADHDGAVRLRRITSAVDTGIAVNPDTIVAQLQGGLIFGLTAALHGEITIAGGRVKQSNFNDYRMLRIATCRDPRDRRTPSSQAAEARAASARPARPAGPPALRNALYAATGIALRRLPIDRDVLAGRKAA